MRRLLRALGPAAGREGELGLLHWVGPPSQGPADSPLGPVASDLGDEPHHAERLLLPQSSAQGCSPAVTPARSSLCVPFVSSSLLLV